MKISLSILMLATIFNLSAQTPVSYNLADMLKNNQIETTGFSETKVLKGKPGAISSVHPVLFRNLRFTEGIIDIDLRGKNKFLASFLGIIFHAEDTNHLDALFFRPFNFKHPDTARHYWSVTYLSLPDYPWMRLRKEHPRKYENKVNPVPDPNDWFHARIVVQGSDLKVYVNNATEPCLETQLLNNKRDGKFGLFSDGLKSDFANLVITPLPEQERTVSYNLTEELNNGRLKLESQDRLVPIKDTMQDAVGYSYSTRLAIHDSIGFSSGTIEIDLKGRDLVQQSFVGIAFHVKDKDHYEVVYCRPFNFNNADSMRRHHSIQYMQIPEYPWDRLRKEFPEQFESNVPDPPNAESWFHLRVVVRDGWITGYVNYSIVPALHVKSLGNLREGKIALWSDGLYDKFAHLSIDRD